jgi:hypothetical protein
MQHDKPQEGQNQQTGTASRPGKDNPVHNSSEKKPEQGQKQPGQMTPKKEVQGGEKKEEHRKTGTN